MFLLTFQLSVFKDVAEGISDPLFKESQKCPEIHGETGLDKEGGGHIFGSAPPKKQARKGKGVLILADTIMKEFTKSGEKVTLIFTGPLTNGAALFILYPEIKDMVEVVLMGGSLGVGNTGPVAEFNLQTDPDAAKIVFNSGVHLTMVPLEVGGEVHDSNWLLNIRAAKHTALKFYSYS